MAAAFSDGLAAQTTSRGLEDLRKREMAGLRCNLKYIHKPRQNTEDYKESYTQTNSRGKFKYRSRMETMETIVWWNAEV